jgi:hypothetical protein
MSHAALSLRFSCPACQGLAGGRLFGYIHSVGFTWCRQMLFYLECKQEEWDRSQLAVS